MVTRKSQFELSVKRGILFNFIIRYKVVSMSEPVTIQMKTSELCTVF